MIILGIDPGTASLGYGIVERAGGRLRGIDYGVFTTRPDRGLPERLLAVHRQLADLIELHAPDLIGVERLFFSRNAQTAFAVGQARGVVLLAAAEREIPVLEATPSQVKSAVAGYGGADKEQVARMARVVLGLDVVPSPDDAADALAVAICVAGLDTSPARAMGALDLAAVGPRHGRGPSGYERAVRRALALERTQKG